MKSFCLPRPETPDRRDSHRYFAALVLAFLAIGLLWGVVCIVKLGSPDSPISPMRAQTHQVETAAQGVEAPRAPTYGRSLNVALGGLTGQAKMDEWLHAFRYKFLGDLGPQVSEGCPGWLFYRDGLRPPDGHREAFAKRLMLMKAWASRLSEANVELLVVTVPDKSSVETTQLCGLERAAVMRTHWVSWQSALRASGVHSLDLTGRLVHLQQAYYRTDVHLSPEGAETVADQVAAASLVKLGGIGPQRFVQKAAPVSSPRMGDLIVLAGLDKAPEGWRPELEQVKAARIEPLHTGGLLDDGPAAEVMLVGDSNGLRSEFAARLGRQLGREIWNQSQDGGYFSGAMIAALAGQSNWPRSLRLVVWQFSELSLSLPLSSEEVKALAELR